MLECIKTHLNAKILNSFLEQRSRFSPTLFINFKIKPELFELQKCIYLKNTMSNGPDVFQCGGRVLVQNQPFHLQLLREFHCLLGGIIIHSLWSWRLSLKVFQGKVGVMVEVSGTFFFIIFILPFQALFQLLWGEIVSFSPQQTFDW